MTKIRSIAIQWQKLRTTDTRVARSENPIREIAVPFCELVFQLMMKNVTRVGKPLNGPVVAYHASVSELRQLMEADRKRDKAVWTFEERETFLHILNSVDGIACKMLAFLRYLLYALLFILSYLTHWIQWVRCTSNKR